MILGPIELRQELNLPLPLSLDLNTTLPGAEQSSGRHF